MCLLINHNGVKLVDGGILNPVPIAPTFNDNTDMIIAVNLGGDMEKESKEEVLKKIKKKTASLFKKA